MNHVLGEAEEPILKAIERLLKKDEDAHPFIVIDKVGRPDLFVQFAPCRAVYEFRIPFVVTVKLFKRSYTGNVFFDAPPLGIYLEETPPERGARRAIEGLYELGLAAEDRIVIHEQEDEPPPWKGEPFWKRLFS